MMIITMAMAAKHRRQQDYDHNHRCCGFCEVMIQQIGSDHPSPQPTPTSPTFIHHNNKNRPSQIVFSVLNSISLLLFLWNVPAIYADSNGGTSSTGTNHEERVVVKGIAQKSASLPCYIDEDNCGAIYFLTWSRLEKDDRWSRIWVYSDDNVNKALSSLTGRAIFTKQKSEASLVINSLKPSDEAFYKCDVTYVAGKCPSLTYVQLNVIAKPTRSWIEHEGDILTNGHHLSLTEGDFLKLACTVIDGRPKPIITWRSIDSRGQKHELKKSSDKASASNTNALISSSNDDGSDRATLVLTKKLTRDDLGSKFECHIEHEAINNGSLDQHVVLDVNVGIKNMEIIGPSTSVREGDIAVIECVAYASKPAAEIVWRNGSRIIDGHSIQNTIETNIDRITVNSRSKLEIIVGHQDHLNPITCEAANVAMRTPINKSTEISVLFAPIVVMEPQNGLTVNESTPMVSILCTYYANPYTLLNNETLWYRDGRLLDTSDSTRYSATNSAKHPILTILNVDRNDTGHYHCTVANTLGSGVPTNSVFLNVLYPPTVSLLVYPDPSSTDYLLKEGDDLRLVCDIQDGNPRSASKMRWLKNNGENFSELDGETSSQKELSWLSIPRTLTGNYTCQAFSSAGISELSNEVEIIVHYPPGKSIIRLLDEPYPIKGRNLTLECIVNDRGRPSDRTEYHWENNDGMIFGSRESTMSIQNLRLMNRGNISCAAVNEVGFGARGMFELIPYAPPRFINPLPPTIGVNEDLHSSSISLGDNYNDNNNNNNGATFNYATSNEATNQNGLRTSSSDNNIINLYCRVECFPLCSISWLRNDQPIDNSTNGGNEFRIIDEQMPEEFLLNRFAGMASTLQWNITHSGRQHLDRFRDSGTVFSCVASGNLVGKSIRSDSRFQVEYAPENLRLSSTRVDVIENEHLPEIRCDSDALPLATYRWVSNSFYDKFTGVIADTPILALNRTIQRDSSGTYTCIASNRHGERRIDLQINVLYRPSCTIYESRTGKDNQDVVLICEVTFANPATGLEYSWSLNGTQLNESYVQELAQNDGMKSKIIISAYQEDLFGTWTCSVRNTVGQTDPNCTLFVDAPIVAEWSSLGDESILIISAIIVAIIFGFLFILLCLIFLMKRRRHKNDKDKRENPDGDRSPTPSSSTSRVSSNQNDLISQKSQASSKKATETERLSSSNSSASAIPTSGVVGGDVYENMTFHGKQTNCLSHLNGTAPNAVAASFYMHQPSPLQHNNVHHNHHQTSISPVIPPTYDNATKTLANNNCSTMDAFRRTQSARYSSNQNLGLNIYSICNDLQSQAMLYADLKLPSVVENNNINSGIPFSNNRQTQSRNNILPPGIAPIKDYFKNNHHNHHAPSSLSTINHHHHSFQMSNVYQQLVPSNRTTTLNYHLQNSSSNNGGGNGGSSSDSSTPPSLSTSSTNSNNNHYNGPKTNNNANNNSNALIHHTYDRPDSVKHQSQQLLLSNTTNNKRMHHSPYSMDDGRSSMRTSSIQRPTNRAGPQRSLYHPNNNGDEDGGTVAHCEYAILKFDHPPSPQSSQC